jgi:HPt (histidine-containing phosphotransfer) domain-containing protein
MVERIEPFDASALYDYKIIIHGIKGASSDLFAERAAMEASLLEHAAEQGNAGYIELHNPPFISYMNGFLQNLADYLAAVEAERPKPRKDAVDTELLRDILHACTDYDMDEAEKALEELEGYEYESGDDGELIAWLRDNIDVMNFTQIAERLEEILND